MIQDRYDGPKDDPKNLATQSDITALKELIAQSSGGYMCYPDDDAGILLENTTGLVNIFSIVHPEMNCVDVCIFDTVLNRWVSAGIQINNSELITIQFRTPPANNRYRVHIRGKLAS